MESLFNTKIPFMKLIINNRSISLNEILEKTISPLNEEEIHCFDFINEWFSEKEFFIVPTSGSTGIPKLIKVTRQQMQYSAKMTGEALKLKKGMNAFVCLSTQHIAGKMMLVRAFELDLNLTIVTPSSNPFEDFSPTKIDFIALVPFQLQSILESNQSNFLENCHAIIVGGAPVSYDLAQKIKHKKSPIFSTYGMTETVSHIALKLLNGKTKENYFQCLPNVIIKQDERNCLTIQSPVSNNEILITNDLVNITSPSSFEWLGRVDNVINSGGIKIQIEQVEQKITEYFYEKNIANRFIIGGINDEQFGTKVVLIIEGKCAIELNSLKPILTKYELPKLIFFIPSLVETKTGKIDRKQSINKIK